MFMLLILACDCQTQTGRLMLLFIVCLLLIFLIAAQHFVRLLLKCGLCLKAHLKLSQTFNWFGTQEHKKFPSIACSLNEFQKPNFFTSLLLVYKFPFIADNAPIYLSTIPAELWYARL